MLSKVSCQVEWFVYVTAHSCWCCNFEWKLTNMGKLLSTFQIDSRSHLLECSNQKDINLTISNYFTENIAKCIFIFWDVYKWLLSLSYLEVRLSCVMQRWLCKDDLKWMDWFITLCIQLFILRNAFYILRFQKT